MSSTPRHYAAQQLQSREQELDHRERELASAERELDASWTAHEDRLRVLTDLEDYVRDRERMLVERAQRLNLRADAVDYAGTELLDDTNAMSMGALSMERAAVLDDRERLCARRESALRNRRQQLAEAARAHSGREQALLEREARLASAFRQLVTQGRLPERVAASGAIDDEPLIIVEAEEEPASWGGHSTAATSGASYERDSAPGHSLGVVAAMTPPRPAVSPVVPNDACDGSIKGRRYRRIELAVRVDACTEHNFFGGEFFGGETQDLGIGGVFIATNNLLQRGRLVRLRLALPEDGTIEVDGEVAWRRVVDTDDGPIGIGVRFVDLSDQARTAIERFAHRRSPLPAPGLVAVG